jgi:hypothetical protein
MAAIMALPFVLLGGLIADSSTRVTRTATANSNAALRPVRFRDGIPNAGRPYSLSSEIFNISCMPPGSFLESHAF